MERGLNLLGKKFDLSGKRMIILLVPGTEGIFVLMSSQRVSAFSCTEAMFHG